MTVMEKNIIEALEEVKALKARAEDAQDWFEELWHEAGIALRAMEADPDSYTDEEFEKAYDENNKCADGANLWEYDKERWAEVLNHLEVALKIIGTFDM